MTQTANGPWKTERNFLTPMSGKDIISPYNINTISSRKVTR